MQRDRSWIVVLLVVLGIVVFVGLPLTTGLSARLAGTEDRAAAGERSKDKDRSRDKERAKERAQGREKVRDKARDNAKRRLEERRADRRRAALRWFATQRRQGFCWPPGQCRIERNQRGMPWWMMGPKQKPDRQPAVPGGSPSPGAGPSASPGASGSPGVSPSPVPSPSLVPSPSPS